jgi:hypothetical protein
VPRLKQKTPVAPNPTRSEQKAAQIDTWVKGHIAELREADKVKTERLKALREAREAELSQREADAKSAKRATSHGAKHPRRIWVSGPETRHESKSSNS